MLVHLMFLLFLADVKYTAVSKTQPMKQMRHNELSGRLNYI